MRFSWSKIGAFVFMASSKALIVGGMAAGVVGQLLFSAVKGEWVEISIIDVLKFLHIPHPEAPSVGLDMLSYINGPLFCVLLGIFSLFISYKINWKYADHLDVHVFK